MAEAYIDNAPLAEVDALYREQASLAHRLRRLELRLARRRAAS